MPDGLGPRRIDITLLLENSTPLHRTLGDVAARQCRSQECEWHDCLSGQAKPLECVLSRVCEMHAMCVFWGCETCEPEKDWDAIQCVI